MQLVPILPPSVVLRDLNWSALPARIWNCLLIFPAMQETPRDTGNMQLVPILQPSVVLRDLNWNALPASIWNCLFSAMQETPPTQAAGNLSPSFWVRYRESSILPTQEPLGKPLNIPPHVAPAAPLAFFRLPALGWTLAARGGFGVIFFFFFGGGGGDFLAGGWGVLRGV